jgi:hypothetical protein
MPFRGGARDHLRTPMRDLSTPLRELRTGV